ncbi:MAG: hypothetical protein ALAOOOJD_02774 [bacterium]|nr:hypothetical protein [bacterium]
MKRQRFFRKDGVRVTRLIIAAISASLSIAFAGAIVTGFRGEPGFNKVTLKWTAEGENNLKTYEIQRALINQDQELEKNKITAVEAKGSAQTRTEYVYEDNSVFKTAGRTYYYRLKIVDQDGRFTYSPIITVSPTISSARQTWGSIKAMFR